MKLTDAEKAGLSTELEKLLTADKLLRVTEAAGPGRLRDEQWAAAYARAVSGAIGKPMIRVDVPSMTLTY